MGQLNVLSTIVFSMLFIASNASAGDDLLPARDAMKSNTLYIDGNQGHEGVEIYNLKNYTVEKRSDKVQAALDTYKKKSNPNFRRRIWVTNKKNGTKSVVAEFTSTGAKDKIVFSNDENFMYYLGISPAGEQLVYGINLTDNNKFSLGAGSDVSTVTCANKETFVLVQGSERKIYQVYSTAGKKIDVADASSPVDIEKSLCR